MKQWSRTLVFFAMIVSSLGLDAYEETSGSGTVAETMNVESYVYVRLEEDGTWLAAAPVEIAVGDKIKYANAVLMKDFSSRTLGRVFDDILFVGSLEVVNHEPGYHHKEGADPHAGQNPEIIAPRAGEIPPLEGGKTIAEILASGTQLAEQQVSLRARVMKVSLDILGKNWITLQDGTGEAPNDQLIANSADSAEIGELVTVTGVVHNDVDIGSGYHYAVLLEQATFER